MSEIGEDFGGYMEDFAAAEEAAARHQQMLDEHEVWRQTTWGGFFVRTLQAIAKHFKPFFMKVVEMMQDDESTGKRVLIFFLNLMVIFMGMIIVYAVGKLVGYMIGGDIVQEEEVVIVHEYETEEEAQKAMEQEKRATSRGKKRRQKEE